MRPSLYRIVIVLSTRRTLRANHIQRHGCQDIGEGQGATLLNVSGYLAQDMARNRKNFRNLGLEGRHFLIVVNCVNRATNELIYTIFRFRHNLRTGLYLILMLRNSVPRMKRLICHEDLRECRRIIFVYLRRLVHKERRVVLVTRHSKILQRLTQRMFLLIREMFRLARVLKAVILRPMDMVSLRRRVQVRVNHNLHTRARARSISVIVKSRNICQASVCLTKVLLNPNFRGILSGHLRCGGRVFRSQRLLRALCRRVREALNLHGQGQPMLVPRVISTRRNIHLFSLNPLALRGLLQGLVRNVVEMANDPSCLRSLRSLRRNRLRGRIVNFRRPLPVKRLLRLLGGVRVICGIRPQFLKRIRYAFLRHVEQINRCMGVPHGARILQIVKGRNRVRALILIRRYNIRGMGLVGESNVAKQGETSREVLRRASVVIMGVRVHGCVLRRHTRRVSHYGRLIRPHETRSFSGNLLALKVFAMGFLQDNLIRQGEGSRFVNFLTGFSLIFRRERLFVRTFFRRLKDRVVR